MDHNPHEKSAHKYNAVDDLAQSLVALPTIEVLQTYPSQQKELLTTLGAIDQSDSQLMTFDLHQSTPQLLLAPRKFPQILANLIFNTNT